ncbi:hybrid sensor histidine kinase/response regulator [Azospirillum canadense]|uniref:hybrid sensor histidine kinase/response regulator n=1 Tax=Azospirillum canadense TaxID=403962 RepID=UPI002225C9E6|nr:ATP-binding protein [Azospirillum canadense]MCW2244070.1 signal transduction histidine kinase/CheY-like chemotaxis protein/HAMP domain-containing protein [Azospirillum canadense]
MTRRSSAPFRTMTLPTRLILLVLLATLPAIGIQAYNDFRARQAGEALAVEEASRLLTLIQDEQQRVIDGVREVLVTVAEIAPTLIGDQARCQTFLARLRRQLPRAQGIVLTDLAGVVRCASEQGLVGNAIGDLPHIRMALFGQPFAIGDYVLRRTDGRAVLPFGVPFTDADGRVAGAVGIAVDAGWMRDYLARKPLPPHADLLMADRNGVLLGRFPDEASNGGPAEGAAQVGKPLPAALLSLVRAESGGVTVIPGLDGHERIIASAPVQDPPQGLFMAVGLDRDEAMRARAAATRRSILLLSLSTGLALAAAWFGARAFVLRPVARVQSVIERWRAGDHEARTGAQPDGTEIGDLAQTFDAMADELQARERAREEAHAAERRMAAILASSTDAVLEFDRNGVITFANDRASALFGGGPLTGRSYTAVLPAYAVAPFEERFRPAIDLGVPDELEVWFSASDEWHALRLFPMGNRLAVYALDVTARKRMEDDLRRAKDQAERANRAKSRFLAAASHDLRQPVQSLFFFATALSDQMRRQPTGHATVEAMQQALEALKRLLDGLLDISKLDAGVVKPVPTVLALQPVFDRLAAEYRPQAARKGLDLRIVATGLHVRSDAMLLERILRNLLDNALRYTPGGRILLGARRCGGDIHVTVCDSGIGVPPERREEIFEEFTQIGNPERDRERGLGLGLAIVRRLSALLEHPLTLRSELGRGSAFTVAVPRAAAPPVPALVPKASLPRDPERPSLVLVIDDEVIILMGLRAMLEGWGYEVIAATAEEEAIGLLEKDGRRPDLVLADYRLRQGKTGPEALRAVHAHFNAAIPSIILTGDTAPERIVEAQRSGFSILHKPVSAHHLRKVVGEVGGR